MERCATSGKVEWTWEVGLDLCLVLTGALPQRERQAMRPLNAESGYEPDWCPSVDQSHDTRQQDVRQRDMMELHRRSAWAATHLGGAGLGPGRQGHPRGMVRPGRRRVQGRSPAHPRLGVRHVGGGVRGATGALRRRLGAAGLVKSKGGAGA